MAFDYSYVLPPTGPSQNEQVREMFDDVRNYVNTLISGGGTGAPDSSQYVTLATDSNLTNERVLTAGSGISLTDNGAGSTIVVANTGVRTITTTNVNSNFSPSSGAVVFSFSVTPTFSSIILQSATGAIGITPSGTSFTSYNLTLPLDTGSNGQFLTTNGATPTATLTWSTPTAGATRALDNLASVAINTSLLPATTNSIDLGSAGKTWHDIFIDRDIVLFEETTSNNIIIKAPTSLASYTLTLPDSAGTSGYVLRTDGSGTTTWVAQTSIAGLATDTLNNLGSTAVNASIIPATFNAIDLGSTTKSWRDIFVKTSLRFRNTNVDSAEIVITAPSTISGVYTLTLPNGVGTSNQVLTTNGSGVLSWQSVASIGGANTALSNLASVAINTTLVSDTNNTDDLGTSSIGWKDLFLTGAIKSGGSTLATTTELGYLTGVTSAIQTQLNAKANTALSNLASVAINTSLLSDTDNTDDLGSILIEWANVFTRNLNVGSSGNVGNITIYPPTALKGNLQIVAADNASSLSILTITNASQASSRTYTIPDAGQSADFVLNKGTTTVAGDFAISRSNSGGTVLFTVENTSNTATSNAKELIKVAGTTANDAFINFQVSGTTDWSIGLDNSVSGDPFKLSASSALGTSDVLTITTTGGTTLSGTTANMLAVSSDQATTEVSIDNTASDGDPFISWKLGGTKQFSLGVNDGASDVLQLGTTAIDTSTMWQMTSAGERTMPLQPACLAYVETTIDNVSGDGTDYTVIFDTEVFDQGADFNLGTSTFTAPVTGRYLITAAVRIGGIVTTTHTTLNMDIVTSNRSYRDRMINLPATIVTWPMKLAIIADMDVNDTCTIHTTVGGSSKVADVSGGTPYGTFVSIGLFV